MLPFRTIWYEPCHVIRVLCALRKFILQTRMRSHPLGLDAWILVGPFVYFHASCVWTAKALARLLGWAVSPEPSLVAYMICTIISWAGSYGVSWYQFLIVSVPEHCTFKLLTYWHRLPVGQNAIFFFFLVSSYLFQFVHCIRDASVTDCLSERTDAILKESLFEPHRHKTNKMACAPSEDSDQPGHPPSLIRVFAVRLKKARILSYPMSALRILWSDWAHMPFCWFCHDAAHMRIITENHVNANPRRAKKHVTSKIRSTICTELHHNMSRRMTKATEWHLLPAKTQISLGIRPIWPVFTVRSIGS